MIVFISQGGCKNGMCDDMLVFLWLVSVSALRKHGVLPNNIGVPLLSNFSDCFLSIRRFLNNQEGSWLRRELVSRGHLDFQDTCLFLDVTISVILFLQEDTRPILSAH